MASQPVRPIKRDSSEPGEKPGGLFTLNPYLGAAITTEDTRYKRIDFKDMRESSFQTTHQGGWVAMIQHYFVDRKSTRLNSSHVAISYAVFCLKKKTKKIIRRGN